MKRISLLVVIVALAPVVSQASFCTSQRYRIRYSPYAFSYHNPGLIPGTIKYSPYAFNPDSAGLVYEGARYTPYAFNSHNPGLVIDYYCWPVQRCAPCVVESGSTPHRTVTASLARRHAYAARRASASAERLQEIRETDGECIVRQYLEDKGLDDVRIDRRLCIENQTAGAAFIFRDKNLVVRYTNPEIMEAVEADGGSTMKVAQRYEEGWQVFAQDFETQGGTVYCVNASEPDQIVAALDACDMLSPAVPGQRTTMFAKE
jgi:hypothetical protein